jgi:porin
MNFFLIILLVFLNLVPVYAQENESPIKIETAYVGDFFSNFSGGLKTGQTYLGLIDFSLGFNTEELGLWKNGEFFTLVENTHGGSPTGDYIGDLQVASNIDNGDYTYIYEIWYKQQFNNLGVQVGLIDLNADYFVAEPGGLFINSSFGIQPSASMNIPVPIFPMNALGINLQYQISEAILLQTGIWDGDPGNLDSEPYNVKWNLGKDQGFLSATELHVKHSKVDDNYLGTIKLGILYHSTDFVEIADSSKNASGNIELHLIGEQTLINKPEGEKGKLDAFLQFGYLPNNRINQIPIYIGAGINYTGLLMDSASDVLGFGITYAGLSKKLIDITPGMKSFETAIELSYALPLNDQITIQPDLQYIINPGATGGINNAFVGFVRVIIEH